MSSTASDSRRGWFSIPGRVKEAARLRRVRGPHRRFVGRHTDGLLRFPEVQQRGAARSRQAEGEVLRSQRTAGARVCAGVRGFPWRRLDDGAPRVRPPRRALATVDRPFSSVSGDRRASSCPFGVRRSPRTAWGPCGLDRAVAWLGIGTAASRTSRSETRTGP